MSLIFFFIKHKQEPESAILMTEEKSKLRQAAQTEEASLIEVNALSKMKSREGGKSSESDYKTGGGGGNDGEGRGKVQLAELQNSVALCARGVSAASAPFAAQLGFHDDQHLLDHLLFMHALSFHFCLLSHPPPPRLLTLTYINVLFVGTNRNTARLRAL